MWNYRVVRTEEEQYDSYQLYEVYYDDDGKIEGMTENAMQPYGESVEELQNDLEYMMEALKQPVLDMKELEKQFKENPPWAELVAGIEAIQNQKRDS
jgi:hypothetical protein|tara:strand:+ start:43 stop:333 length:291 start_codon:yes stop_codon:yes gene_type:complete